MRTLHILLFIFISNNAFAGNIYKGTNEEGQVFYSDKPVPGTELMPPLSPNTVQMPKAKKPDVVETADEATSTYKLFEITRPENETTLRHGGGNIIVQLKIDPALDIVSGHRINLYLDGKKKVSRSSLLKQSLRNTSRGSHSIHAEIVNAKNQPLQSSNRITLHMKRLSSQHKQPTGTAPGSVDAEGKPYLPGGVDADGNLYRPGPTDPAYSPGPQNSSFKPGPILPTVTP